MVGGEARRQHEAYPPAPAGEPNRALGKQLVAVRVAAGLRPIDAGVAREAQDSPRLDPRGGASIRRAGIRTNHVPRRITDHGVESRLRQSLSALVEECFREFELPVKESVTRRNLVCGIQIVFRSPIRQGATAGKNSV